MVAENTVLAFMVFYAVDGNAAGALDGDGMWEGGAAGEDGEVRGVPAEVADGCG